MSTLRESHTSSLTSRVSKIEEDITDLRTQGAQHTSLLEGVRSDTSLLFGKLDQLLSRPDATATRGMIPVSYVTWGIGALLTIVGLFFTASVMVAGVILFAVNSGDEATRQLVDHARERVALLDQQHGVLSEKVSDHEAQWLRREEDFLPQWGAILEKVAMLEQENRNPLGGHDDTLRRIALLEAAMSLLRP